MNYSVASVLLLGAAVTNAPFQSAAAPPVPPLPRVGPNLRLGDDPAALTSGLRAQAEPHIARSPVDPDLLIAAFQEGRYTDGAAAGIGTAVSRDGGLTWARALLPGITRLHSGSYHRAGDSVAAFDLRGAVYLVHGAFESQAPPPTAVVLSRAVLGSTGFDRAAKLFGSATETDKPWLAVNTFPGTSTEGRLVATANIFGDGRDGLYSSHSDDQGATWSARRAVGPRQGVYCQNFFLPDGSLGVLYFRYLGVLDDLSGPARLEFLRSADGGVNFEEPVAVLTMTGQIHDDGIARDAYDLPMACTDRDGGVIYATIQAQTVVAGVRAPRILFTRSTDQGRTWSPAVAVNDTPSRQAVFNPCIAASADGLHVTIAFYDKRHNSAASGNNLVDYYLAESFDGGGTWEPNVRLSEESSDLRLAPLTRSGRMLADYQGIVPAVGTRHPGVAVWIDTRTGSPDPFAVRIARSSGPSFEAWQRLRFPAADLASPAVTGFPADPDGDGIPNGLEMALGLHPLRQDPGPLDWARVPGSPQLRLGYDFRPEAVEFGAVGLRLEHSLDLAAWSSAEATVVRVQERAKSPTRERAAFDVVATAGARFFRLRAVQQGR